MYKVDAVAAGDILFILDMHSVYRDGLIIHTIL